jgi:hypothetical protein
MVDKTRKSGEFRGKSNALGQGGRAAQLKAKGVPGGVIGAIARRKGAAPGGPNYHANDVATSSSPAARSHAKGTSVVTPPKKGPGLTPEVLKSMASSLNFR